MMDDGQRLSYSIRGTSVTVTNNLNGTMLVKSATQKNPIFTLDKSVLYNHVNTIQQIVMKNKFRTFGYKPFTKASNDQAVSIIETDHFCYRLIVDGKCAELTEVSFKGQRGFDVTKLIDSLSYVYSVAANSDPALQPKRDIVRRIADVGILVWVYEGHTLVCKDTNINGCTLLNCLVDNDVYKLVYVSVNTEADRCYVFDINLNEIFSAPIDNSILAYFHDDLEDLNQSK